MKQTKQFFSLSIGRAGVGLLFMAIVMMVIPAKMWAQSTFSGSVTKSNAGYTNQEASKAFDGDTDTKWCGNNGSGTNIYVEFNTSNAMKVGSYTFTTGGDTKTYPVRNPKTWVLKGKVNATDAWTEIDSKTDCEKMPATNNTAVTFYLPKATATAYQYFRIDFTHEKNTTFQLSEISLSSASSGMIANGDGTQANPYQIATAADLEWFARYVNEDVASYSDAYYVLTDDIENLGAWTPIGTDTKPFKGTFDGQGHSIKGMSILRYTTGYKGLFGKTLGATVKNFSISGEMTSGTSNSGTTVQCIGGAIGWAYNSTIEDVTSSVNIKLDDGIMQKLMGGVVGSLDCSVISGCIYTGTLNAGASNDCIGGIAGYTRHSVNNDAASVKRPKISNCHNAGTVKSTATDACIAGILAYQNTTTFQGASNCLNTGSISAGEGATYIGAIYGHYRAKTTESLNNYYMTGTAAVGKDGGGNTIECTAVTADELARGKVCYLLNGSTSIGTLAWYQNIDTDNIPVLDNSHKVVYKDGENYINSPYTVTASTAGYTNQDASKTFDFSTDTKWCCKNEDGTNIFVEFNTSNAMKVGSYTFTTGDDTDTYQECNPKTWVLKGKVNVTDAEWTVIDTQTDNTKMPATNKTAVTFYLPEATATAFQYFRIDFTHTQNATFQLSEISLSSAACPRANLTHHDAVSSCTADGNIEYWTCDDCGQYFNHSNHSDESKITAAAIVVAALGHSYDEQTHLCTRCQYPEPGMIANGNGTQATPYQIATAADLEWFARYVNAGNDTYNAAYYELSADIDLSGISSWTPIGTESNPFMGTINGQGHSITGMTIAYTTSYQGLFGNVSNATLKSFTVAGSMTSSTNDIAEIGGAAGKALSSAIENVVSNVNITISGTGVKQSRVAGVVGNCDNTTLSVCTNNGTINAGESTDCIAGVAGYAHRAVTIKACLNTGTIKTTGTDAHIAGIIGYDNDGGFQGISNCLNIGVIDGSSSTAGAIFGYYGSEITAATNNYNYYKEGTASKAIGENPGNKDLSTPFNSVTETQLGNGSACYLLNGKTSTGTLAWYQQLPSTGSGQASTPGDATPVLKSTGNNTVYCGYIDHTLTYANTALAATSTHDFVNGICSICRAHENKAGVCTEHSYSNGVCTVCGQYDLTIYSPSTVLIGGADDAAIADIAASGYSNFNYPFDTYYDLNSTSITLYTSDEIGQLGTITSIAFYVSSASTLSNQNVKIYMKMVDTRTTKLTDSFDAANAGFTLVYTGNDLTLGAATGWETYNFDTPFAYDNAKNLLVAVTRQSSTGNYNFSLRYAQQNKLSEGIAVVRGGSSEEFSDISYATSFEFLVGNSACMKMNFAICSGHTFADGEPEVAATCSKGSKSTCTKCGKLVPDGKTPATGAHNGDAVTHKCLDCDSFDASVVQSGKHGECEWSLTSAGALAIFPKNGTSGILQYNKYGNPDWNSYSTSIKSVKVVGEVKPNTMCCMFAGCTNLVSADLTGMNTANVEIMQGVFSNCQSLKTITFGSSFNTANATTMYNMFYNCRSLEFLDLSFNTEKVTDMTSMFENCFELKNLKLSGFNTANVTSMYHMFKECSELQAFDLDDFNTANVEDFTSMFEDCLMLKALAIGNFDMRKAKDLNRMFFNCGTSSYSSPWRKLKLKALPFLQDNTFNSMAWPGGVTYDLQLNDNSIVYDGTNYLPAATATKAPTYTRTIAADCQWGTAVMPFEAKSDANVQLYALTAVGDGKVTLSPVGTVAANTPCIFKKKVADATSVVFTANSDATPAAAAPATPDAIGGLTLTGTYSAAKVATGEGYVLNANQFVKTTAENSVSPFQAYLSGAIDAVDALTINELIGDINGDGIITIADLTRLVEILNGRATDTNGAADVDGQNGVTVDDVDALSNKVLGK